MRHLVTGGAGFIGSHLIDALLDDGNAEVICVDNFLTGRKDNIATWIDDPRFELIRHDVCEPLRIEVDRIWHLACPASPRWYQANPIATTKTNVLGTLNMLGLARRCNARLLLASTSEVYGDAQVNPQPETYWGHVNNIGIRSCYDEGKRVAESLCFDYARYHGIDVAVARIFNTYGPRMASDDGRVISNFISQALCGRPLTIYGDGQQTRSFCFVSDLVAGLIALMNSGEQGPINLGNPNETTIEELAELIAQNLNPGTEVLFHPLPADDPQRRRPVIDRAQKLLNWQPRVPLQRGLASTAESLRQQLNSLLFV
jgi:UDP-glucuronate decarboxylase